MVFIFNKKQGKAHRGLALIQQLYKIERQARPLTATERTAYRKQHVQPVLDTLRDWLDQSLPLVPPKTALGKALNYLHNE